MRSSFVVTNLAELLTEADSDWSRDLAFVGPAADVKAPAAPVQLVLVPQILPDAAPSSLSLALKRAWAVMSIVLVLAGCVFWALFLRPQSLAGPAAYVLVSGRSMLP